MRSYIPLAGEEEEEDEETDEAGRQEASRQQFHLHITIPKTNLTLF